MSNEDKTNKIRWLAVSRDKFQKLILSSQTNRLQIAFSLFELMNIFIDFQMNRKFSLLKYLRKELKFLRELESCENFQRAKRLQNIISWLERRGKGGSQIV